MTELGRIRSVHKVGLLSLLSTGVMAAACFAIVVVAIRSSASAAARLGGGALFFAGGAALVAWAIYLAQTRVEVCDEGLRQLGWGAAEVRWRDVRRLEVFSINGKRTLFIHTDRQRLALSRHLDGFDALVETVRDRSDPGVRRPA